MNELSQLARAVLAVVHRQYPAPISAKSITDALKAYRVKPREVENILRGLTAQGYVKRERTPFGDTYTYRQK